MQHTYLRYECADAFGLTTSSASSKSPHSNSILAAILPSSTSSPSRKSSLQAKSQSDPLIVTTAGSQCIGFNIKQNLPCMKVGHREHLSGGVGTGLALNSDEVVCIDIHSNNSDEDSGKIRTKSSNVIYAKVATGWIDGTVRVFDLYENELTTDIATSSSDSNNNSRRGLIHSLLPKSRQEENEEYHDDDKSTNEFVTREPLVLNGHSQTPVRSITFDRGNGGGTRLASGGSDGSVVIWDIISETGLFRLLGHKGGITDIMFVNPSSTFDGLITTSLDGLVKVWDLNGQFCIQTIASHNGEVLCGSCINAGESSKDKNAIDGSNSNDRLRLVTGSTDGQVRVWSVQSPKRYSNNKVSTGTDTADKNDSMDIDLSMEDTSRNIDDDDNDIVCHYMGKLIPPPNISTSNEKIVSIHYNDYYYDSNRRRGGYYIGVLHNNSKNIDVYLVRNKKETLRKKQRRLRRKREKKKGQQQDISGPKPGKKRGMLDDPESSSSDDDNDGNGLNISNTEKVEDAIVKASDEFEYFGTVRASHKVRGFIFIPQDKRRSGNNGGSGVRVVCALTTNALEVHSLTRQKRQQNDNIKEAAMVVNNKISVVDMYGHPTGIRAIALSSDDVLACTVSKNITKIWNVSNRSCVQSLAPTVNKTHTKTNKKGKAGSSIPSCYGLCATFLPGNTHVVLGTREGHLLILDIASGDVVYAEENAHDGAIWSIDLRRPTPEQETIAIVTGSADKTLKFWDVEAQDDNDDSEEDSDDDDNDVGFAGHPMVVHTRTLEMTDDVVAVRYSHSTDPSKRMVFASTLDCTIKVFFDDTLKFFLSLYGHKLPALAVDAADDDTILASSGADKTIKIWGLDFGDTHRTLHGHQDSITDLRFVKRTHNFFTTSKDGTVRYWDGDRFEQILLLNGHCAEVNCLAVSRTGAFVLSGGMDRQVRVWERTKDIVFPEEEKERELEQLFDKVDSERRDEGGTGNIMRNNRVNEDDDTDDEGNANDEQPQSEAAIKRSVLSVSSGDRIMEGVERADQELKDIASFRKSVGASKQRSPNPFLLGMEPDQYVLWVLRSVKSAELEQSLLVLPLTHMERLVYYLIVLLKSGRGIELCSRIGVFLIKVHQHQIVANSSMATPLMELRRLVRMRLSEVRNTVGFNLAALRAIAKAAHDRKNAYFIPNESKQSKDIWAGLGLGSDVAAALESKRNRKN